MKMTKVHSGIRYSWGATEGVAMLKLLLALAVVVGIVAGATQVMHRFHSNSPAPAGPVTYHVNVPNPLGGGSVQQGGSGPVVIP